MIKYDMYQRILFEGDWVVASVGYTGGSRFYKVRGFTEKSVLLWDRASKVSCYANSVIKVTEDSVPQELRAKFP